MREGPPTDAPDLAAPTSSEPARKRLPAVAWEVIRTIAIVLVVVATIRTFVAEAYVIQGSSMEPTLHSSERLLITKFAPQIEGLDRGDIVIFEHPDEPGKRLIKRVVGLPGETIEIKGGLVYVNGKALDEPYQRPDLGSSHPPHKIPEGYYFVLGDNRSVSNDSRSIGDVPSAAIIGRAFVRFYPSVRVF